MKAKLGFTLALLLALGCQPAFAQAVPNPLPVARSWIYQPISNGTDVLLGEMRLSTTRVSFTELSGHMDLVFEGAADDPESLGSAKAHIFRVTNAVSFFQLNKGKNGFCHKPIKWFGVAPLGDLVRVFFYTLDDYRHYSPMKPGLCGADTFRPRARI